MASPHPESLFVIIAAYNEETVIGGVISGVLESWKNVVVVDDGSSDRTASAALAAGATVLVHPINLGQGAALQTAICYALQAGADYIATFDADGQHLVSDIAVLLKRQQQSGVDVALGSRFLGTTVGMSRKKGIFLKAAVQFTRFTSGVSLSDAHNGLRLFTRRAALQLRIRQNRMAHASEIVDEIRRHRWTYVEVPVSIIYSDYSKAKGQRMSNAANIVTDLIIDRFMK